MSSTLGTCRETVKCVEHLPGLPYPVAGEAGELFEDARLRKRRDGAQRVLRGDAELARRSSPCLDPGSPAQLDRSELEYELAAVGRCCEGRRGQRLTSLAIPPRWPTSVRPTPRMHAGASRVGRLLG